MENFNIDDQTKLEEIKKYFLSLNRAGRKGFLISLEKALEWIEYRQDINFIKFKENFKRRYLQNDYFHFNEAENEEDYNSDYIIRKEGKYSNIYFSDEGFKMFCMIMNTKKASLVRKYFIMMENKYVETLYKSQQEIEIERNEYEKLTNDLSKELKDIEIAYENQKEQINGLWSFNQKNKEYLQEANHLLDYYQDEPPAHSEERISYELIKTKMIKAPLYLVKPGIMDVVKKPKNNQTIFGFDMTESNKEEYSYEYSFDYYNKIFIEENNGNDKMFYYIQSPSSSVSKDDNYNLIYNIHFVDKNHYKEFMNIMQKKFASKKSKNILYISFNELMEQWNIVSSRIIRENNNITKKNLNKIDNNTRYRNYLHTKELYLDNNFC